MSGRRRRPTEEQLKVWRDFIETAERLKLRMAKRMQEESILTPSDYQVLLALQEAEGRRLRSTVLAEACEWQPSRLSHQLKRMEARDLITRRPIPGDLRGSEILITETGTAELRRGAIPHLEAIADLFVDALSPEELAAASRLTLALQRHLDANPA